MTDDIRALKAKQHKHEVIWRENPLFVNFEIFQKSFRTMKYAIDENKTQTIHIRITDSNGDKKNFRILLKPYWFVKRNSCCLIFLHSR